MAKSTSTIGLIILIFVALATYGLSFGLASLTMVSPWAVAGCSAIIGLLVAISWRGRWGRLVGLTDSFVVSAVDTVVIAGLCAALFYGANFWLSSGETAHPEKPVVVRKYQEERYRTRRVGRRYTRGEPYNVYYIDLRFSQGQVKPRQVTLQRYNRIRVGDSVTVSLETGALGIPVIKATGY